ncbi:MAG: hypothetical protein C3F15_01335 [Holophagae bacterium]|nr:MAG: hypothetical protein C3F15_01335 [Holophagae bacterium]
MISIAGVLEVDRRQTMFTGIGHNDVHRLVSALEPFPVDFHRVPWTDRLVAAVTGHEFHLIFAGYPPLGMSLELFVTALRHPGSASREAGLVVIADPRSLETARRLLGRGVNRVHSRGDGTEEIVESARPLLDVAPRVRVRAPVELITAGHGRVLTARCLTEDLSATGMLVSCPTPAPAGATVDFELAIPGEATPIRGQARVARQTDPIRERVLGVGASFLSFADRDQERLHAALQEL